MQLTRRAFLKAIASSALLTVPPAVLALARVADPIDIPEPDIPDYEYGVPVPDYWLTIEGEPLYATDLSVRATMGKNILLGLSARNIELLMQGKPILFSGRPLGVDGNIVIVYGATEQKIVDELLSGASGWNYNTPNTDSKDSRKLVTLLDSHGMTWVGIRAWHSRERYWMNGSDPETARVIAWQDLPEPAPGRWSRGKLVGDSAPQGGEAGMIASDAKVLGTPEGEQGDKG